MAKSNKNEYDTFSHKKALIAKKKITEKKIAEFEEIEFDENEELFDGLDDAILNKLNKCIAKN